MGRRLTKKQLEDIVAKSKERTAERVAVVKKKRSERKSHTCAEESGAPTFSGLGGIPERVPNSTDVERWFKEAMTDHFSDVYVASFLIKDQALCKKLLKEYGADVVQRGIAEAVATWGDRPTVRDGFHPAAPTIVLIWKIREEIFGGGDGRHKVNYDRKSFIEQERQRKYDRGEWSEPEGEEEEDGIGWGD